jgi:hypothetical protein
MSHTPGPWEVNITGTNTLVVGGPRPDRRISYVYGLFAECPEDERLANARLMAAAPELLEALERARIRLFHAPVTRSMKGGENAHNSAMCTLCFVESAIRKATGQSEL